MDKPKRKRRPNYMAYLPPRVRYDPELRPTAKLLYAEITALAETDGYCWASNKYLAAVFAVSEDTITRQIAQLAARGYLELRMEAVDTGSRRSVYLTDLGLSRMSPWWEKVQGGVRTDAETPVRMDAETGVRKNAGTPQYKNDNNTPYSPPEGDRVKSAKSKKPTHKDHPDWKPDDFERLWEWYPTGEIPRVAPRGNRQRAIRAWDNLRPDDELVAAITGALERQAKSEQWAKGVGVPHFSTYLNGYGWEGWEREEDVVKTAAAAPEVREELPIL